MTRIVGEVAAAFRGGEIVWLFALKVRAATAASFRKVGHAVLRNPA
jgi:hypothetical protein